jgi:phosphatidylglycerophosphate synthase
MAPMHKQVPNALTISRLVLAIVFFAALEFYRYAGGV